MEASSVFDPAAVMADAQRKEALTDWGPGEFEGPLRVLLADYARADLNAIGAHILRSGIVHSLVQQAFWTIYRRNSACLTIPSRQDPSTNRNWPRSS